MKNAQGLKTLGDYRRAAKDSLFGLTLSPESKSGSAYDAIKTALAYSRDLIYFSRVNTSEIERWGVIYFPKTKYELKNLQLFYCIKLMEFVKTYNEVQSVDELFPKWPKRPDVNIKVFTVAGISFLEAAFNFVRELGSDIILMLQNAYKKQRKEGNIIYLDPFKFLSQTPIVDDLEISPVPDIIIKTWFDNFLRGMQRGFPENEFSNLKVEAEFNSIQKQLEYEWNAWKKASDRRKTRKAEPQEKGGQSENWHNDDFTEVVWNGKKYKFNKPQQALSVEYLWKNKRAREKSIGEAIRSEAENFRLIHIFRQQGKKTKMHSAWGTMIVADGKGIFALAECKKAPK